MYSALAAIGPMPGVSSGRLLRSSALLAAELVLYIGNPTVEVIIPLAGFKTTTNRT